MTLKERITELATAEGVLTASSVASALSIHRVSAKGILRQMAAEDRLQRIRPGYYSLPAPAAESGNTIGRNVPSGTYTRQQAADMVSRSPDTLIRWQHQGLCVPSESMQAGKLRVWLYTSDDIERLKTVAATRKPGRPKKHADSTARVSPGRPRKGEPAAPTYRATVVLETRHREWADQHGLNMSAWIRGLIDAANERE